MEINLTKNPIFFHLFFSRSLKPHILIDEPREKKRGKWHMASSPTYKNNENHEQVMINEINRYLSLVVIAAEPLS